MRRRLAEEAAFLVAGRIGTPSVAVATQTPRLRQNQQNKVKTHRLFHTGALHLSQTHTMQSIRHPSSDTYPAFAVALLTQQASGSTATMTRFNRSRVRNLDYFHLTPE